MTNEIHRKASDEEKDFLRRIYQEWGGDELALKKFEKLWADAGDPPRPKVSQRGGPVTVAARQWAAYVAQQREQGIWRKP